MRGGGDQFGESPNSRDTMTVEDGVIGEYTIIVVFYIYFIYICLYIWFFFVYICGNGSFL